MMYLEHPQIINIKQKIDTSLPSMTDQLSIIGIMQVQFQLQKIADGAHYDTDRRTLLNHETAKRNTETPKRNTETSVFLHFFFLDQRNSKKLIVFNNY